MTKEKKLSTPEWILKGYNSEADYNKTKEISKEKKSGKTFKLRKCPKCGSHDVKIVLSNIDSEEGGGKEWECKKCGWKGTDIKREELNEQEFMKYLDNKGEEVA